jgi:hypothetical protein
VDPGDRAIGFGQSRSAGDTKPASINGRYRKLLSPRYFDLFEQLPGDLFTILGQRTRSTGHFLQKSVSDLLIVEHWPLSVRSMARNWAASLSEPR